MDQSSVAVVSICSDRRCVEISGLDVTDEDALEVAEETVSSYIWLALKCSSMACSLFEFGCCKCTIFYG